MSLRHHLLALSLLIPFCWSCAPTVPTTTPRVPTSTVAPTTTTTRAPTTTTTAVPTTTTTLPPCCRTNIIRETGNRALFNPALNSCPVQANFICSVMVDLQILPNTIIINGGTVIANGPMGENSFAVLKCNDQKVWEVLETKMVVDTISCISTP